MTDSEMEDLCLLHSALKEKGEGEIKRIKEKYECTIRASNIKGRRGELRGLIFYHYFIYPILTIFA